VLDGPDALAEVDVFGQAPIRPEALGHLVLEGMLLGRPVIGSAGGLRSGADH
jgi:hypothetical protein